MHVDRIPNKSYIRKLHCLPVVLYVVYTKMPLLMGLGWDPIIF